MKNHEYSVEFRIYGENLDPEIISKELGLHPNRTERVGDVYLKKTRTQAMWSYDGNDGKLEWESLEAAILFIMGKLENKISIIEKYKAHYDLMWWCGHFQSSFDGGPEFSADLLKRLGHFGVKLYINCHFFEKE